MPDVNIKTDDLEVEEIIEIEPVPTPLPNTRGLLDWVSYALTDLADAVDRLNDDLDKDISNRAIGRDIGDILSLRRWSFIFPGGGAIRGNHRSTVIRPATRPSSTTATVATPTVTVPPTPVRPQTPPPAPKSTAATGAKPDIVIKDTPPPTKK